ncbi:formate dehydrogenase accessory sulfurtransferase FdhD, partial [Bacillus paralicheniformis]|uniref:formate dehydrogenase accessory sulfurtransferase FdhD n=1 Tax=Bacillus paralicheniformis TaxID=1648923 RepID=UPI0020BEAAE8
MGPTQETYTIVRYQSGTFSKQLDQIVRESPVTIKLNGEEYVTVVCTPNYIKDMVIGFLISLGIISSYKNVEELWAQKDNGIVHVKSSKANPLYQT